MYYLLPKAPRVLDWHARAWTPNIVQTPSFEKDMGNHKHRVVLMPRKAVNPESNGS